MLIYFFKKTPKIYEPLLFIISLQIPDITLLFASFGKKRKPASRRSPRIESGSIGEEEYETLYKEHFENMGHEVKTDKGTAE